MVSRRTRKTFGDGVRTILEPTSKRYVSIASAWELAIKIGTGKLVFDGGVEQFFYAIGENGIGLLPITEQHVKKVEGLPPLHRDPFDRLLVSTALVENLTIITSDENIRKYEVPWAW
jgi:PIN domain nuclease of toxin-antitoxin system